MANIGNSFEHYGIDLIAVETKKIDLPDDNKSAVYARMISERNNIAAAYLADGEKQAKEIRNEADKEVEIRVAEAKAQAEILKADKMPILLGGEHLVTLGAVRAAAQKYPDLHIIHFDAHADLREEYLGETLSHATVMRRCYDLLGDGRIFQFGIRSGTRDEFAFMKAGHVITEPFTCRNVEKLNCCGVGKEAELLGGCDVESQPLNSLTPIYLTIDLDVLDPADFPGTGTQEAGGLHYDELRCAVTDIITRFHVVALDNVELNPSLDLSGRSTALACKFLRECLLAMSGS